jgi:hypothetical protein
MQCPILGGFVHKLVTARILDAERAEALCSIFMASAEESGDTVHLLRAICGQAMLYRRLPNCTAKVEASFESTLSIYRVDEHSHLLSQIYGSDRSMLTIGFALQHFCMRGRWQKALALADFMFQYLSSADCNMQTAEIATVQLEFAYSFMGLHERAKELFDVFYRRQSQRKGMSVIGGVLPLFYALANFRVDNYFWVSDTVDEDLEELLLNRPHKSPRAGMNKYKTSSVLPMHVISQLGRATAGVLAELGLLRARFLLAGLLGNEYDYNYGSTDPHASIDEAKVDLATEYLLIALKQLDDCPSFYKESNKSDWGYAFDQLQRGLTRSMILCTISAIHRIVQHQPQLRQKLVQISSAPTLEDCNTKVVRVLQENEDMCTMMNAYGGLLAVGVHRIDTQVDARRGYEIVSEALDNIDNYGDNFEKNREEVTTPSSDIDIEEYGTSIPPLENPDASCTSTVGTSDSDIMAMSLESIPLMVRAKSCRQGYESAAL